jgi:hypothetical protein
VFVLHFGFYFGFMGWALPGTEMASNTNAWNGVSRRSIAHCAHYTQEVNLTVLQMDGCRTHID